MEHLHLFKALAMIAVLALANYLFIWSLLGDTGFNIGRIIIASWAGWYIVKHVGYGLGLAAIAGITVLVVDHVILKGGYYLVAQAFWPDVVDHKGHEAFIGVLISFVMVTPIIALISIGGGLVARRKIRLFANKALHRTSRRTRR